MSTPSVNPSGRVQVIPVPIASPGQCGICGKSSHVKGFVDPRLDFEFYGTLIFCYDCAGDMASVFGYQSADALELMRQHIDEQNDELNTLRQAVLGLESAVEGLTNYRDLRGIATSGRGNPFGNSPVPDFNPEPPVTPPDPPIADQPTGGTTGTGTSTEPQPRQSDSVAGPDDVLDANTVDAILGIDSNG